MVNIWMQLLLIKALVSVWLRFTNRKSLERLTRAYGTRARNARGSQNCAILSNVSLLQHTVPLLWKEANIRPVPKEIPFTSCNQLRPISLTNIILRLFERLVYRNELSTVCANHIDLDQFAYRKGHNFTMALLKSQHNWLKWLDGNVDFMLIFSFDFN